MEETTQQTEVTQETVNTPDSTQQASPTSDVVDNNAQAVPAAYAPNYKFKSYDKEYEFDDMVKPLITNKELEDKMRSLYEARMGIDGVKESRDKFKNELTNYKTQWTPIIDTVSEAHKAYQAKDYDTFFKKLGVPEQEVLKYAYQRLQYMEMPAEQKAKLDQEMALKRDFSKTQEELEFIKREHQEMQKQQKLNEIDQTLNSPELSNFISSFDKKNGQGAFREELINRGILLYQMTGKNLSALEVAKDLVGKFALSEMTMANTQNTPVEDKVVQAKNLPTIPVIKGGSASVSSKTPKRLADLEAIRKEKYGY